MIKVIVISDNRRQCYDISDLIIVPNTGLWDIRMKDSFIPLGTYKSEAEARKILNDFANAKLNEFLLKYCSSQFSKEEIIAMSKKVIFEFPE